VTVSDLAIIAALIFAWGTLSARLERFDMTAPITFTAAGLLLTHGPLTPLGVHGLTAGPLAKRYGPRPSVAAGPVAATRLGPVPERRLIRRSPAIGHQADAASQA